MKPPRVARSRMSAAAMMAALALSTTALAACGAYDDATAGSIPVDGHAYAQPGSGDHESEVTPATALAVVYAAMHGLWAQHMQWTYQTVVAFATGSGALTPTLDRLLRNQVDIGDAIAPFYGEAAGKQLTDLLTTHIKQAVPVLTAAKNGKKAALTKAVDDWHANAQDIADFLADANPAWSQEDMRSMMKGHITQTVGYAGDIIAGDYASALAKYDAAETHMLELADLLSKGVIAQFPDKF